MITEDALRELLAEAAESAPPPGPTPDSAPRRPRARATAQPTPRRIPQLPGRRVLAIAAAVVLGVLAVGVLQSDDPDEPTLAAGSSDEEADADGVSTTMADSPQSIDMGGTGGDLTSGPAVPGAPTALPSSRAASQATPDLGTADAAATGTGAAAPTPAPAFADSARVVKTGSIDLEVREGAFTRAIETLTSRVTGLGGYVAESTTSQSEDAPSGAIVVRVPEASFEALLTELRKLGDVQSVSSKGTDVSAQFSDINARLAALTATRDRLGTVLREANNVGDILMVQDRITAVQTEIETYQGQLRLLEDQTSMATLSVTLREPGADRIEVRSSEDERDLGGAWDDARRRFGDGIEGIVAGSGTVVVLLLVGAVLALAGRLAWPRLRRLLI